MKAMRDAFCRCHSPWREDISPPLPENRTDGNGNVVAVSCKRCTRIIACTCGNCGVWVDRMWDHAEACKPAPTPRQKRDEGEWLPGVPRPPKEHRR